MWHRYGSLASILAILAVLYLHRSEPGSLGIKPEERWVLDRLAGGPDAGFRDGRGTLARFFLPVGISYGKSGLYVADTFNHCIRKISPDGVVSTFAGRPPVIFQRDDEQNLIDNEEGFTVNDFARLFKESEQKVEQTHRISASEEDSIIEEGVEDIGLDSQGGGEEEDMEMEVDKDARAIAQQAGIVEDEEDWMQRFDDRHQMSGEDLFSGRSESNELDFEGQKPLASSSLEQASLTDENELTIEELRKVPLTPIERKVTPQRMRRLTERVLDKLRKYKIGEERHKQVAPGESEPELSAEATRHMEVAEWSIKTIQKNLKEAKRLNFTPGDLALAKQLYMLGHMKPSHDIFRNHTEYMTGHAKNWGYRDGIGTNALFYAPHGLAQDVVGNLYVADTLNHLIRKITPSARVTTFAGTTNLQPMRWVKDGKSLNATFYAPYDVTVVEDTVYVSDTRNNCIRRIKDGKVRYMCGQLFYADRGGDDGIGTKATFICPRALAANGKDIYVVDPPISVIPPPENVHPNLNMALEKKEEMKKMLTNRPHVIRKVTPKGRVSRVAGGAEGSRDGMVSEAEFRHPMGLAFGPSGHMYVADASNHKIRRVSPKGKVVTLIGSGIHGFKDGVGVEAHLHTPHGIAVDAKSKQMYIVDTRNNAVRVAKYREHVTALD